MSWPKLLIAALCFAVALLVSFLAAPTRRVPAVLIIAAPFAALGIAALVSARRAFLHDRAFASRRSERTVASLVPDPHAFIRDAPQLAAEFRAWAGERIRGGLTSQVELEEAAVSLGEANSSRVEMFLPWVATVGEAHRHRVRGRWSVSRFFGRGEPVVVSGRFPYLRMRPLPEAIELLDVGTSLEHV
ncbi:MAG: hypothetical protein F9K16_02345 [Thermoanaerobaculia bacterium]|nr:MAG: hypothetical protein F9K16_02345 [Thermoanaerobaculia bacterium]MBZ0103789.1 hypothetical protein [Thermoanaerobaculia bacterium]